MPIIKSSMKDLRRTESRTARNRVALGKLRSNLKHSRTAIAAGDADAAAKALAEALPVNAAARHKSRLMRRLNKLAAPAAK